MKYKPYPVYKDSGVEWLGEVPAHWEIFRVGDIANIINGYPFDARLFEKDGIYPLVRIRDLNCITTETRYNGEFVSTVAVTSDDVLIGMDGDFNVGRWYGQEKALLNQRMCCIRAQTPDTTGLLSYAVSFPLKAINDVTYSTTVKHLSFFQVAKIRIALPKDDIELRKIVGFLDHQTAKIDTLIAKQEHLIELLQEKRTVLISHAVTKGLNPDAPIKDSEVEWLGEVPAHWDVIQFRHLLLGGTRNGIYKGKEHYQSDGSPMIQMGEAFAEPIITRCATDRVVVTHDELETWGLKEGDLLFARRSLVFEGSGKCSMVGVLPEPHIFESSIIRARPDKIKAIPTFLFDFFLSVFSRSEILATTKQVTISGIDSQQIKSLTVLLPPILEQEKIIFYIAQETKKIDTLIQKSRHAIDLLKERRTALISAAVTGKIDVR